MHQNQSKLESGESRGCRQTKKESITNFVLRITASNPRKDQFLCDKLVKPPFVCEFLVSNTRKLKLKKKRRSNLRKNENLIKSVSPVVALLLCKYSISRETNKLDPSLKNSMRTKISDSDA